MTLPADNLRSDPDRTSRLHPRRSELSLAPPQAARRLSCQGRTRLLRRGHFALWYYHVLI